MALIGRRENKLCLPDGIKGTMLVILFIFTILSIVFGFANYD